MENSSICFKETKIAFEEYLLALGYSKNTAEMYRWILSRLERFMSEQGETVYSPEIGNAILKKELATGYPNRYLTDTRLTIRRLDDFLYGKFSVVVPPENRVPSCHAKYFHGFLRDLQLRGLRESSIKVHHYSGVKTLRALYSHEVYDLSEIQPQDIYDVFAKSNDKANVGGFLRFFLRYLFKSGVLALDFSVLVPSVRKRQPIPSVYTKEETGQLLSSIDTSQNSGKRNLAIILLALRLDIRSGNIVNLKIQDIDFQSGVIEFIQKKTHVLQRMEFLPELKDALRSYLSGRPNTEFPNLFLSIRPPFRPLTAMAVTSLMIRCMKRSGINTGSRKRGGHALRMTLASELVSENVPYEVVRKILGHEDTKSMKHYVKFDIDMLRTCALEVPPLTGLFAEYVNKYMGGDKK